MSNIDKNKQISNSLKQTRLKRKNQTCHVFKVKIQKDSLSKQTLSDLKFLFVEAKWLTNELIGSDNIFDYDSKVKTVKHFDKDKNEIISEYQLLSSQMKQSIYQDLISNIKTLNSLKKKGNKIGKLKFRKEVKVINLKQFNNSYKINNLHEIQIPKIGKLRVNGLKQIMTKKGRLKYDIANAKLIKEAKDFYLAITCYKDIKENINKNKQEIGIDFGISTHLTLSNGVKINATVQESDRLKRLQKRLFRQVKGSKNRLKTVFLIRKEYQKLNNKKNDLANKIVAHLKQYDIYMQDEQLSNWKIRYGKTIQHSILGRVKAKLKPIAVNVLDKWEPTTKQCLKCKKKNDILLSDRIYECSCGYIEDRDVHSANNMVSISKDNKSKDKTGQGLSGVLVEDEIRLDNVINIIKHSSEKQENVIDESIRSSIK